MTEVNKSVCGSPHPERDLACREVGLHLEHSAKTMVDGKYRRIFWSRLDLVRPNAKSTGEIIEVIDGIQPNETTTSVQDEIDKRTEPDHNSRRGQVLVYLRDRAPGWIPGFEIATQEVGGSEGLRRLRELRQEGWLIEERPMVNSNVWEYRLAGAPDPAQHSEVSTVLPGLRNFT